MNLRKEDTKVKLLSITSSYDIRIISILDSSHYINLDHCSIYQAMYYLRDKVIRARGWKLFIVQ